MRRETPLARAAQRGRAARFAEDEREAHKQRAIAEERTAPRRALAGAMLPAT